MTMFLATAAIVLALAICLVEELRKAPVVEDEEEAE